MSKKYYNTVIKDYGNGIVEVKESSSPIRSFRTEKEIEASQRGKEEAEEQRLRDIIEGKETEKEIRRDSIQRSFSIMMDLAISNKEYFKTFITLTFSENLKSVDEANKHFKTFIQSLRYIFPDLMYLGTLEFQKRGAVHYHLLTNIDIKNTNFFTLQDNKKFYKSKQWRHGFSTVFDLSKTDDNFNVAAYMGKYFMKDIDNRLYGRRRVLSSRNLKRPLVVKTLSTSEEYKETMKKLKNYTLSSDVSFFAKEFEKINLLPIKLIKIKRFVDNS